MADDTISSVPPPASEKPSRNLGLAIGLSLFSAILLLPTPHGASIEGMRVLAVVALMASLWITEAVPVAATALLPIVLYPLLGVMKTSEVTGSYANHLIYLFMGGFLIAVTMERWNLHRRIALQVILLAGTSPQAIILGFMIATAFLSMWVSNTATTMMMLTIAMALIKQFDKNNAQASDKKDNFSIALMLGIAYAASVGGTATLIGTPPNAILAGVYEELYGQRITFAGWMTIALPIALLMLFCIWFYLTRWAYPPRTDAVPGGRHAIKIELLDLGPISSEERWVFGVFVGAALCWILRGFIDWQAIEMVQDSTIAIAAALLLFLLPSKSQKGERLLNWETAVKIPWDVIVLFGGGFAIAKGFSHTGLTGWIAGQFTLLQGMNLVVILGLIVATVIFLTEVTSNTATASLLLPLMGALAITLKMDPYLLMAATALACSYAFMLPAATPPNAIVYGSRRVTIMQMVRAGIFINILGALVLTAAFSVVIPVLMGE